MFACAGVKPGINFGNAASNPFEAGKTKQSQNVTDSSQVLTSETKDSQSSQKTSESKNSDSKQKSSGGSPPQAPTALISVLNSLGLSPSGSKESDYTNVMNHLDSLNEKAGTDISQKQHISQMRQTFLAVYNSL